LRQLANILTNNSLIILQLIQLNSRILHGREYSYAGRPTPTRCSQRPNLTISQFQCLRTVFVIHLLKSLRFLPTKGFMRCFRNHYELINRDLHLARSVTQRDHGLVENLLYYCDTSPNLSGEIILRVWPEIPTIPSIHSEEQNAEAKSIVS